MSKGDWHVIPINDLQEHQEDDYCPCGIEREDTGNGYILVHTSYDGREHDEPDHIKRDCKTCVDREIEKHMYNVSDKEKSDVKIKAHLRHNSPKSR